MTAVATTQIGATEKDNLKSYRNTVQNTQRASSARHFNRQRSTVTSSQASAQTTLQGEKKKRHPLHTCVMASGLFLGSTIVTGAKTASKAAINGAGGSGTQPTVANTALVHRGEQR